MGIPGAFVAVGRVFLPVVLFSLSLSGCQSGSVVSQARLIEVAVAVDARGLGEIEPLDGLHASSALPMGWETLPRQNSALYTHQQWRAPSRHTAVGVTHVRMPLPLGTRALIWMAGGEITKRAQNGRIVRQWSDDLGREWFEAEDDIFHTTGFVTTRGRDAWIVYAGYRRQESRNEREIEMVHRAMETMVPGYVELPARFVQR